jgi:hypothetical protein
VLVGGRSGKNTAVPGSSGPDLSFKFVFTQAPLPPRPRSAGCSGLRRLLRASVVGVRAGRFWPVLWFCLSLPVAFRPCASGYCRCRIADMRLGIAHHLGWAVAVTASADHEVLDRRRIALVEPGVPTAPIHHEGGPHPFHRSAEPLGDDALAALVAKVRASVLRATSTALDELANASPERIVSVSLRGWPADFPEDIAVQRRAPYEGRADSVMYCKVLAEAARERGWAVHLYDAKNVENEAVRVLGARTNDVLRGPRATLGPPWSKDHRMALAATILVKTGKPPDRGGGEHADQLV